MPSTRSFSKEKVEGASEARGLQAPSISLPKGGGAIKGIDEKFGVNPATGTGSLSVPILVSPGRSKFGPDLRLSYDSGNGNGPFGFGWSLSLPSITRKTDKGLPQYRDSEESDVFILSGTEDLVPAFKQDQNGNWVRDARGEFQFDETKRNGHMVRRYRPRVEGLFARIERWTDLETGDIHWRSISRDNVTTLYGKDNQSRIFDPDDSNPEHPTRVFSWLISESYDDRGNAIVYVYAEEDSERILEDPQGRPTAPAHESHRDDDCRSANRYLKRIKYGNRVPNRDADWQPTDPARLPPETWMFEVLFDYGEGHFQAASAPDSDPFYVTAGLEPSGQWPARRDPFSTYRPGFEVRTYRLCRRVLMFHHFPAELGIDDCLVRSTDFAYSESPIASCITSITQSGYVRRPDPDQPNRYIRKSLPSLEFEYSQADIQQSVREIDPASLENLPHGVDGAGYQWVDLDGEGISSIIAEQGGAWFYKRNLTPSNLVREGGNERLDPLFGHLECLGTAPNAALAGGRARFLDLAGDGRLDLAIFAGPTDGFYERTHDANWQPFRPFLHSPNIDFSDPNLRMVDLNGDGHADVFITENEVFSWHGSLAEEGFGQARLVPKALEEEEGPRLVFADGTQSVSLADLSGDGLTDLVRIRNGEVCYWPNLGYGRFGARVTMDNSPWFDHPDQFSQQRIRLADIDGSGTTDIIYLGRDRLSVYRNQCGNGWSDAEELTGFPDLDSLESVTAVDLLGNGTACLVWSSPLPGNSDRSMRYIDLMGGQKPHLLTTLTNNLGAETRVSYAASTRFYLADKIAGKPWITRIPFPVHVVERTETHDHISGNRFVTRYAYHHGYFDGIEREFRGFGLVEQWDTEEIAALSSDGGIPEATNLDEASHVPPVLTRTWFHTGAYMEGGRISRGFMDEYYRESDPSRGIEGLTGEQMRLLLLEDTVLPDGLSAEEAREACRALKGSILRQEIYALDNTEEADRPYTVSERNYSLNPLQPRGVNPHAVFLAHSRETVDFHYERKLVEVDSGSLADPRVTHGMNLLVDDYGNVLRSAAISYPRRDLLDVVEPEQTDTHVSFTVNRVANRGYEDDWYRVGVPVETRTYEIVNPPEPRIVDRLIEPFGFETIRTLTEGLFPLDHIEPEDAGLWPYERWDWRRVPEHAPADTRLRLIEHVRTLWRSDTLNGRMALGEVDSLALPYESYKLAFTPSLIDEVYGNRVTERMLTEEGGYVHSEGDANWWIPSGRVFYSPSSGDSPDEERAYARRHFFLAHCFRDPFGQETTVTYDDPHALLVQETRDAMRNRVTVGERDEDGVLTAEGNDYRTLQPRLLMGPNRNRSAVAFDTLGMVVGTAVMGKPEEDLGDSLEGFEPELDEATVAAHMENPFLDPHAILGRATSRLVYDLFVYQRTREDPQPQPAVVYTMARETHDSDLEDGSLTRIQHSFSYSDGFGREIQRKIQAEPGPVTDGGPDVSPRWVGSGWTIFNNKGKPVKQYEPFFSATHRFEFARIVGVSPVLFYDPLARVS